MATNENNTNILEEQKNQVEQAGTGVNRRRFIMGVGAAFGVAATGGLLAACSGNTTSAPDADSGEVKAAGSELIELPLSEPDPESPFGVDKNINMTTIDEYLNREDVVYRDARMLFDPADYASIGGNADLSSTLPGFKIVPYPYLATLSALPVEGAYAAETVFNVTFGEDGAINTVDENYEESTTIIDDLFPKDKAIFIMCGGGGYAGMMKGLLVKLGWDTDKIYNVGGNWEYTGPNAIELIKYSEKADGNNMYATWRADYAHIDFSRLHAIQ